MKRFLRLIAVGLLLTSNIVEAQEDKRQIWPEEYLPAAKTTKTARPKKASYKIATPKVIVEKVMPDTVVGVTIWRLRPANVGDTSAIIESENAKWVPERVEGGVTLSEGDRVRLSIEVARDGYVYVINRERYTGGMLGDPYLIFPTTRLTGGNNRTSTGRVIEIPSQTDEPPYFTLKPGRADQIAEVLSIFITPEPINYLNITDQPLKMSGDQVAQWERSWGQSVGRLEMVDGAGKSWTQAEKEAGVGSRLLKHEDPPPQTVYYNPEAKSGQPAFVNVDLQYQKQ